MNEFDKLVEQFRAFPGVGRRQAERFAHFITREKISSVEALSSSLLKTRQNVHFCDECKRLMFTSKNEKICSICASHERERTTRMIVEKDADLNHVERAGVYSGLYFVLGGVLPMRDEVTSHIRLTEFEKLIKASESKGELREIILALSLTPEGEYTSDFLFKRLNTLNSTVKEPFIITLLGRGLSVGSELEYSDRETLRQALSSRKQA